MNSRPEVWLVRHGETEWSLSGQHTSRTDLALTVDGERRAILLGEELRGRKFAMVLSSPMRRARATARLAGFEPAIVDDLREWDYGEFEGLTTPQIQAIEPEWSIWKSTPRGGESAEQVAARADAVIAAVLEAKGDVLIFGHGHMLRVLTARWIGLGPAAGRYFALSTGTISVLGWERATRVVQTWNRTP